MPDFRTLGQTVPLELYEQLVDGYADTIRSYRIAFELLQENGLDIEYLKRRYNNAQPI